MRKQEEMKVIEEYPYNCKYCAWRFEEKIQLRLHKAWHKDWICCWCGVSFTNSKKRFEHLVRYHNSKKRLCRCHIIRDRTVRHCERSLQEHQCLHCGSSYGFRTSISGHGRCKKALHHGKKCCFCFKSHRSVASLERHKKIFHPRGRRSRLTGFSCKYCPLSMSDFQHYRRHVKRHESKYSSYWF